MELDYSSHKVDSLDAKHALLLWPATSLQFDRRYIVAIRGLREEGGAVVPPSPAFQHMRDMDRNKSSSPPLTAREKHFSSLFSSLERAGGGLRREDLQLAWDFTTNSKEDVTGRLVRARDDAAQRLGQEGPQYEIDSIEYDTDELVAKKIKGKFLMPTCKSLCRRCNVYIRIIMRQPGKALLNMLHAADLLIFFVYNWQTSTRRTPRTRRVW